MNFAPAQVADLLRSTQRDEQFVKELQDDLQSIFKLFGAKNYHELKRIMPGLAGGWYYYLTTLSNLQTLGEEYTGVLRLDSNDKLPSKKLQLMWLVLYLGGETLLDRLVNNLRQKVSGSDSLTDQARDVFLKLLDFVKEHKQTFKRIHHSLFYIKGKYYNVSNRVTGIKYVLVRKWLQDDTFSQSFKILGYTSLFYIVFDFIQQLWSPSNAKREPQVQNPSDLRQSNRMCVLCSENITSPTSTACGHVFCWDCLHDSLGYSQTCPMCREVVTPNRVIFLQNYL